MSNPFRRLVGLLAPPPLLTGVVVSTDGSTSVVTLLSGGSLRVRGTASVGATVYHQGGVIQGLAPSLSGVDIEV